jgi:surfeit locus 1 family protein
MRIANRDFKPSLAGTVATVLLLPVLVGLGFWQLRRADEKRLLIEQYERGANTVQLLNATTADKLPPQQEITTRGKYDGSHQVLLDNMPSPKRVVGAGPGYEILTPLQLDDGAIVLVNRGWVPLGRTRAELPAIPVGTDSRSVRGRFVELSRPGFRMGSPDTQTSWPRVLNYPNSDDLRKLYGSKLLTRIVLLDPSEPDGFDRDWSARLTFGEFGPERHIAYAIQWFGLAFTVIVVYFVVSLKR